LPITRLVEPLSAIVQPSISKAVAVALKISSHSPFASETADGFWVISLITTGGVPGEAVLQTPGSDALKRGESKAVVICRKDH
jgi:hypothetical protein